MNENRISIHPKFAAAIDLFFGVIFVLFLRTIDFWPWLLLWGVTRLFIWFLILQFVYYPENLKRRFHFFALLIFGVGTFLLLLFLEWKYSWLAVSLVFVLAPAGSFWLLPEKNSQLNFFLKPYRRARFWLTVFGMSGIWSGLYAFHALQLLPGMNPLIYIVAGAILTAFVSRWWLKEYNADNSDKFNYWQWGIFLLVLEFSWVILQWPLGYFINGFLVVWFWYIIFILARFYLSEKGVDWKKQTWFFAVNALLMILFLCLARWR